MLLFFFFYFGCRCSRRDPGREHPSCDRRAAVMWVGERSGKAIGCALELAGFEKGESGRDKNPPW